MNSFLLNTKNIRPLFQNAEQAAGTSNLVPIGSKPQKLQMIIEPPTSRITSSGLEVGTDTSIMCKTLLDLDIDID